MLQQGKAIEPCNTSGFPQLGSAELSDVWNPVL